ncbi:MAG TPA: ABC transporter permease [Vicinamibacterales bacterium]|nr:ABC transporter permease [Vicinamibacterales bacterium]
MIGLARWLLRRALPADARDAVLAELDAEYAAARTRHAGRGATAWYWRQVGGSLVPALGMRRRRLTRLGADALQDARVGVRSMLRAKAFSAAAVLTLALGIGATTAMFTIVDRVLLRPLPYAAPEQLIRIWSANPRGIPRNQISPPDFFDWRDQVQGLTALAGFSVLDATITTGGEPQRLAAASATANLVDTLGGTPLLGRWFAAAETAGQGQPVAVIGEALWRERFGGDPAILGRAIAIDGTPRTVVGVMPRTFHIPGTAERLWLPLADAWRTLPRNARYLGAVGRLAPGVSTDSARTSLAAVAAHLAATYPDADRGWGVTVVPLRDAVIGDVRRPLVMLLAAIIAVLAIACANVASLLLARGVARRRELAIRAAVGAGAGRLVRMQVVEATTVALAGGALGILLAWWLIALVPEMRPLGLPLTDRIALDWRALVAATGLTLGSAVLTAVWPAWKAARPAVGALAGGGRSTGNDVRMRQAIVAGQIAVATALVSAGLLLIVSVEKLTRVPTGFDADATLLADMALPSVRYPRDAQSPFYDRLLERVRALPGVRSAGAGGPLPLSGLDGLLRFLLTIEGVPAPGDRTQRAYLRWATPEYFQAMGIRLVAGRGFTAADRPGSTPVAVIDAELARRYFRDGTPIGRRVRTPIDGPNWRVVVGIVAAVRQSTLEREEEPHLYVPEAQTPSAELTLVVRSDRDAASMAPAIRAILREMDPELPLSNVRSSRDLVADAAAPRRLSAQLLAAFALLALLLTLVGVYGVMSQIVMQSTKELGIRLALGATESRIVRLTVRRAARMAVLGAGIGLAAAWLSAPALSGVLYGIAPRDPWTLAGAATLMVTAALAAAYLPSRRLLRLDVVQSLRDS